MSTTRGGSMEFGWTGIYRAKVIDSKDPDKQGKVKVWIPDTMPEIDDKYGIWAKPANNVIGGANTLEEEYNDNQKYQGMWMVPTQGSYIYLFFENGDPNQPRHLSGADFGQQNAPIENQQGEYHKKWTLFKSRQGRTIIISDDPFDERVEMTGKKRKIDKGDTQSGSPESVYEIDDNQSVVLIDERDGKEKILIKDYKGNYINIDTENNKIDIESPEGEMNVKAAKSLNVFSDSDVNIKSSTNINIEGEKVNIKAKNQLNIESSEDNVSVKSSKGDVKVQSKGNTDVNSKGQVNVKSKAAASFGGSIVNLKSDGIVAIDGTQLVAQNGASQAPTPSTASSASNAEEASPVGDRSGPSASDGENEVEPLDAQAGGTTLIPPIKESQTKRFTNQPPNVTGSDR